MINSRSLDDLLPPVKERVEAFLALAKAAGKFSIFFCSFVEIF